MRFANTNNYPKIPSPPKEGKLRNAIQKFQAGEISLEQLKKIEEEVVIEVIKEQEEVGLDIITDGQIRWEDPIIHIGQKLENTKRNGLLRYFDTNFYVRQPIVEGEIRRKEDIVINEYKFAKQYATKTLKVVLTGPLTLALYSINNYYGNIEELTLAYAKALNEELKQLMKENPEIVQIDEPVITVRKELIDIFLKAMEVLTENVNFKEFAIYLYFGDIKGIEEKIFGLRKFNVIGLDFRSKEGNWDILKDFDKNKVLGFGIVDARNTRMEDKPFFENALNRLQKLGINFDKVIINPNMGIEFLPRENAYDKLKNMVKVVKEIIGG